MNIKILKQKESPLLSRKRISVEATFKGATPSKSTLKKELATKLKAKEDLIEIGCHTHYHQNLNILNEEETTNEIKTSKDILEKILKKKINHFSIPFGTKETYSNKTINIIASQGFKTNVTTNYDLFKKNNILKIPRIGIGNNDIENRLNSKLIGLDSLINKLFR